MIRKLLLFAAAASVPLAAVAVGAVDAGQAGAGTPLNDPNISCSISGTVTFAPPGISYQGTVVPNKTSSTVSTTSLTACSGGMNTGSIGGTSTLTIVSKNAKCPKVATNAPPTFACAKPNLLSDSSSGFSSSSTTTDLKKAVKKLRDTAEGFTFKNKPAVAAEVLPNGACGSNVGFQIQGAVKATPKATYTAGTLLTCLTTDTGPGTSGSFVTDLLAELGGNTTITIATATIGAPSALMITHP